jgi:alkanesulfonate monooxygenase SsuD/methylene tetrahydromethanopterin reductase-like flavin-dependent oxidoreductase (luciferase family)
VTVRFTYAESMCDPGQLLPLAVAAEQAGFSSFTVPDSIAYPQRSASEYPYTDDGSRAFLEDRPFLEPFSLIPALGAVTERLRFTTFVVKLPIREPVLVAKSAASVAVLTDNRLALGVGLSPWPEDYRICGQEWKDRGARMDEMIAIVRGLTSSPAQRTERARAAEGRPAPPGRAEGQPVAGASGERRPGWLPGEFFEFHGRHYDLEPIKICPVPTRPIPILIGGHADAALRRAARVADGWMHAGGGEARDLDAALGRLAELRREHGREREPFEIHVISLDAYTPDGVRRLEDQGVTDAIVGFRNAYEHDTQTLEQKLDALRAYADRVIAKA